MRDGVGERGVLMGKGGRDNVEKDGKAERDVETDGGREREIWRERVSVTWKVLTKYLLNE